MKNIITVLIVFLAISTNGQIVGNKEIVSKTFSLEEVYRISIQMYAKVYIDMDQEAGITITGESNLIDLIRRKERRGVLLLDQKKWIEPTQELIIKIGAPGLRELEMGTHDKTVVTNIRGDIFKVEAPIGEVVLKGEVDQLRIKAKMGRVDASELTSETAIVKIKSDGEAIVNASGFVECDLDEDSRFVNVNTTSKTSDCENHNPQDRVMDNSIKYINLKIKNNSLGRKHFAVVGPKPDGRKFSYGFPLMPLQSKKERWTVGTKIYRENSKGKRTLLVTLTAEDENETVKLFGNEKEK